MNVIPRRHSLISQTLEILRQGILSERWRISLPGERKLSEELQVSRWTIHAALAELAREKLIAIGQGRAGRIIIPARIRQNTASEWKISCVLPGPLWQQRSFVALWIDALRERLQKLGGTLEIHGSPRYFKRDAAKALANLTQRSPSTCWLLVLSTKAMQAWFQKAGLPVIVAGTTHQGIEIPSVDFDFCTIGRHAAGIFLARGHRRIAIISSHRNHGGVIECIAGVNEALAASDHCDAEVVVEYNDGTTADVCNKLDRVFSKTRLPTALLLTQPKQWLTASGYLAQRGLLAPRDLSVIVSIDEPYLSCLVPEPARFEASPNLFARQVARLIERMREHILTPAERIRLLPDFYEGGTIRKLDINNSPPAAGYDRK